MNKKKQIIDKGKEVDRLLQLHCQQFHMNTCPNLSITHSTSSVRVEKLFDCQCHDINTDT